jgi:hypothetical protein
MNKSSLPAKTPTMEDVERKFRMTGRTTRAAVRFVEQALSQPGKAVEIFDHHPTKIMGKEVTDKVAAILSLLNVEYLREETSIKVLPINRSHLEERK